MKFNESTKCLVNTLVLFKYLERDLYTVPYLFEAFTFVLCVKFHHSVKVLAFRLCTDTDC